MTTIWTIYIISTPVLGFALFCLGYYRGELIAAQNFRDAAAIKVGRPVVHIVDSRHAENLS